MSTQPKALRLADALDARILPLREYCLLDQEAAAELRRLRAANIDCIDHFNAVKADVDALLDALQNLSIVMQELHDHWDNDRDMKVGKGLLALSGLLPGYDKRIDVIHAAMAKATGGAA